VEKKIAEYQAAQATYLHYDSFRWQAGSLLIAGVFVFWGLLVSSSPPATTKVVGLTGILVSLLMTIWVLFAHHYRQIYLCKLDRIVELEKDLGFEQHRRFSPTGVEGRRYIIFGPKGHHLDLVLYICSSLGGSIVAWVKAGFGWWLLAPVPIIAAISAYILVNEHKILGSLNIGKGDT